MRVTEKDFLEAGLANIPTGGPSCYRQGHRYASAKPGRDRREVLSAGQHRGQIRRALEKVNGSLMKLDRQSIAGVGLQLLAEGGLKNLSTRKCADRLGVKSASLYHHFRNKQQLLDEVADEMIRPALRRIGSGETWNEWLFEIGAGLRRCVLAYPDGGLLYAGASPPPDREQERVDTLYQPLLDAGLSREMTRNTVLSVIRFTIGWVVDEQVAHERGTDRPREQSNAGFEFGLHTLIEGVWKATGGAQTDGTQNKHKQR